MGKKMVGNQTFWCCRGLHVHVGDISKEQDVQELFKKARDAMGGCNVLINNAGLHDSSPLPPLPLSVSIAVGVRV